MVGPQCCSCTHSKQTQPDRARSPCHRRGLEVGTCFVLPIQLRPEASADSGNLPCALFMCRLRRPSESCPHSEVFLWMAILAVRIWMYAFQLELHEELALKIVPHAFASAALLGQTRAHTHTHLLLSVLALAYYISCRVHGQTRLFNVWSMTRSLLLASGVLAWRLLDHRCICAVLAWWTA